MHRSQVSKTPYDTQTLQQQISNSDPNQGVKQPPIRIRQEQVTLIPSKNQQYPRIYFNMLTEKKDILCLYDQNVQVYNWQGETFSDLDLKLKRAIKSTTMTAISPNGMIICCLSLFGNLVLYRIKQKEALNISGIQSLQLSKDDPPALFINDEGTTIIIKPHNQDYMWMWTMTRNLQLAKKYNQDSDTQQKKGFFRSNSSDRGRQTNERGQLMTSDQKIEPLSATDFIKGTWNKIFLKDFSGPLAHRNASINEGFDIRFINNVYRSNDEVKLVIFKLYDKTEYFGGKQAQNSNNTDEEMVVEITTSSLRINFANKGGTLFESSSGGNSLKSKISTVEFIGHPNNKNNTLITKIDGSGQLAVTILNSIHMVYCQIMFSNIDTNISTTIKLFDFVTPEDCPPFDNRGKTNLCIDDVSWANNDAFVILLFSSASFAIIPRLGSSLIAVYNPTILNISQQMVDQFKHYQDPKAFNELIIPKNLQQKLQQTKAISLAKHITMHPYEDSFIVSDGQLCYQFRIELEPELPALFSKTNMSFFFLRFCISLDKLAVDADILEKIPQLLTNKLPLFEFEKNAELDEEEDPGQIIMTASQINPYEHGQRRMETNQSFNADFNLDCQTVLLNLKHLLMGLRWTKNQPINYYQWLITVVNDTFFYFLKNSEPVYAFHALRMAEAYCKKVLYDTQTENDQSQFENRNQEYNSTRADFSNFEELKKFFDPIHNMYDYHNTQEYMDKSTAEKLLLKFSMLSRLPNRLTKGSGNWRFQFQKNYTLLVYYSLIQFRNYQAANFNILFLVFACYIMQRYLDSMFLHHLQRIIEVVYRNFQLKKKSDDYELFLGKSGKNFMIGPPDKIKLYQEWVTIALKESYSHLEILYDQENLENIMDTIINDIQGNVEKVEKNISFLEDISLLFVNVKSMQMGDVNKVINNINSLASILKDEANSVNKTKITEFSLALSLHIFAETVSRNLIQKKFSSISLFGFVQGIHRMIISTDLGVCQVILSNHSKIFDNCFTNIHSHTLINQQLIFDILKIETTQQLSQMLSLLFLYTNDIKKATQLLNDSDDNILFRQLILSSTIKQSLKQMETINNQLKDQQQTHTGTQQEMTKFWQKTNCSQSINKALNLLKLYFYQISNKQSSNNKRAKVSSNVWISLSFMPTYAALIVQEELGHQSLSKMSKILKYLKIALPSQKQNLVFYSTIKNNQDNQSNFPLLKSFLQAYIGEQWHQILQIFGKQDKIRDTFMEQFELVLISLINTQNSQLIFQLKNDQFCLRDDMEKIAEQLQIENQKNISLLFVKNFSKLIRILNYLKQQQAYILMEQQIQTLISKQLLDGQISTIDDSLKVSYLKATMALSKYEKYQNSQLLITKAFNLIVTLIPKSGILNEIQDVIQNIDYQILNRSNKQKLNTILEIVKSKPNFQDLTKSLENIIFSSNEQLIQKSISQIDGQNIISIFASQINLRTIMKKELRIAQQCKHTLFQHSIKIKDAFGISFDYSFYFDKASFDARIGHILGISDKMLEQFSENMTLHKENKRKKTADLERDSEQSFRSGQQKLQAVSSSSLSIGLSPQRLPTESIALDNQMPTFEITKALMKGRQYGGQVTPRAGQQKQFNLQQLKEDPKLKANNFDALKGPSSASIHMARPRSDSIDFDNKETKVASIQKITKRRNSVRRQIIFKQTETPQGQPPGTVLSKDSKARAGHRKGQMSVAQNAGGMSFKNQKLVSGNYNISRHTSKEIIAPPGLPKARVNAPKSSLPIAHIKKLPLTKEAKLQLFCEIIQNYNLTLAFRKWRTGDSYDQNQSLSQQYIEHADSQNNVNAFEEQQNIQHKISSGLNVQNPPGHNNKQSNNSFNLLFVKVEGENYTVQNTNDIIHQKNRSIKATTDINVASYQTNHNVNTRQQPNDLLPNKIGLNSRPFEFIRVNKDESQIQQELQNASPQKLQIKKIQIINHPSSSIAANSGASKTKNEGAPPIVDKHKANKQISKQQYLSFMVRILNVLLILILIIAKIQTNI